MRIGFIGLGSMGSAIALNLLDNGVDIVCWNRSSGATEPLASAGATVADDVRDVLQMDIVLSMLADDEAVRQIFTESALAAAPNGAIHVAMETLSPREAELSAKRHRAAGISYVAAPVIGRPPVARAGHLHIICAGVAAAVQDVQPILDIAGSKTWTFGENPSVANVVKACVNFNIIHALQAMGESMALLDASSVDSQAFIGLLNQSLFPGPVYEGYGRMIATRRYTPPGFDVKLGLKDLSIAEQIAADAGFTLPSAATLRSTFEQTLANAELSGRDWSVIAETLRSRSIGLRP